MGNSSSGSTSGSDGNSVKDEERLFMRDMCTDSFIEELLAGNDFLDVNGNGDWMSGLMVEEEALNWDGFQVPWRFYKDLHWLHILGRGMMGLLIHKFLALAFLHFIKNA